MTNVVEEVKSRNVKLSPAGLSLAESIRNVWCCTIERGVKREDIEDPGFWGHIAARLRPWDHIEVRSEDGIIYAEYLVLSCDRTWARVRNLSYHNLTDSEISQTQAAQINGDYEVKFRGVKKFSVVRKSDRSLLQEGLHTEADAKKWLDVYLNSQGVSA